MRNFSPLFPCSFDSERRGTPEPARVARVPRPGVRSPGAYRLMPSPDSRRERGPVRAASGCRRVPAPANPGARAARLRPGRERCPAGKLVAGALQCCGEGPPGIDRDVLDDVESGDRGNRRIGARRRRASEQPGSQGPDGGVMLVQAAELSRCVGGVAVDRVDGEADQVADLLRRLAFDRPEQAFPLS